MRRQWLHSLTFELQGLDYFAVRQSYYDAFSIHGEDMDGILHIMHHMTSKLSGVDVNRTLSFMQLIKYGDHLLLQESLESSEDLSQQERLALVNLFESSIHDTFDSSDIF